MIDNKLQNILNVWWNEKLTDKEALAEIKQAFANEGYRQIFKGVDFDKKGRPVANDKLLFTGQEWYDRFEKELYKLAQFGNFVFMDETINDILAAARKAAGL